MKKRISLLITLIISLFVFSGRVEAAKELTCVYEGELEHVTMLVQTKEGKRYYFVANVLDEDVTSINFAGWKTPFETYGENVTLKYETSAYDNNNKVLTSCPKWTSGYAKGDEEVVFYDESKKLFGWNEHKLNDKLSCEKCLPTIVSGESENKEEIENNNWTAKCAYSDEKGMLYLYFNESKITIDSRRKHVSGYTLDFDENELYDYYKEYNYCPYVLYEYYITKSSDVSFLYNVKFYIDKPSGIFNKPIIDVSCTGGVSCPTTEHVLNSINLKTSETKFYEDLPDNPPIVIDDCKDLFGDDLIEMINGVMNWVKILVPILLIVYGIIDFTKAVFSGSEDDMNKSKKTFFKRIVAALLVFIAPIFINLILSLGNQVWGYISPDACIGQNQ